MRPTGSSTDSPNKQTSSVWALKLSRMMARLSSCRWNRKVITPLLLSTLNPVKVHKQRPDRHTAYSIGWAILAAFTTLSFSSSSCSSHRIKASSKLICFSPDFSALCQVRLEIKTRNRWSKSYTKLSMTVKLRGSKAWIFFTTSSALERERDVTIGGSSTRLPRWSKKRWIWAGSYKSNDFTR